MINYIEILTANPVGVLATRDGDGVKTRMFQYLFAKDNKVYFRTGSEKSVYQQIKKYQFVSFCTYTKDYNYILSINGKATFVEDITIKERVLNENPMIKNIYKSANNPIFQIFYIDVKEVQTFNFKEGPKLYQI